MNKISNLMDVEAMYVPVYVKLTARELLEQPIRETAKLINKSKQNATNKYV